MPILGSQDETRRLNGNSPVHKLGKLDTLCHNNDKLINIIELIATPEGAEPGNMTDVRKVANKKQQRR